ncbi:uncharacterized protein MONBRDRAFT_22261 [Monosiga brevicollis MX1]|uniref:Uncharacterized protein n=1 Tax=Monosiga brevicollis TaxID=81824 RepID=A9UQ20_MONBE|nr:uncharacterized protein MONBRDRAFT_22261 [Monosiga brevicollis MX1]EDQ92971.1 predicted protein [Monosiga brevicollis MX1]|eukprot:XP_001742733.1 hypothetical protein [Monosiga brevicollis MX1]
MFRRKKMPESATALPEAAKKTFARGVDQNMKIILRGERGVGKSTLFARLQGKPVPSSHQETSEIQPPFACTLKVTNIPWKYKNSAGVVKAEIWDVVDKGKPSNNKNVPLDEVLLILDTPMCLDASFVDVYKGTHGVILLCDVTKKWTVDYVIQKIADAPPNIPTLILANFVDKQEGNSVTVDEIRGRLEEIPRPANAPPIHICRASLANVLCLLLHLPLRQRQWHEAQLARNKEENARVEAELTEHGADSEEQDFTKFMQRRQERMQARQGTAEAASTSPPAVEGAESGHSSPNHASAATSAMPSRSASMGSSMLSKFRTSFMRNRSKGEVSNGHAAGAQGAGAPAAAPEQVGSVDDFKPAEALPDDFFADLSDDPSQSASAKPSAAEAFYEDDDDDNDNPLVQVAADTDELDLGHEDAVSSDSEDEAETVKSQPKSKSTKPKSPIVEASQPTSTGGASGNAFADDDDSDDEGENPLVVVAVPEEDSDEEEPSGVRPEVAADDSDVAFSDDDEAPSMFAHLKPQVPPPTAVTAAPAALDPVEAAPVVDLGHLTLSSVVDADEFYGSSGDEDTQNVLVAQNNEPSSTEDEDAETPSLSKAAVPAATEHDLASAAFDFNPATDVYTAPPEETGSPSGEKKKKKKKSKDSEVASLDAEAAEKKKKKKHKHRTEREGSDEGDDDNGNDSDGASDKKAKKKSKDKDRDGSERKKKKKHKHKHSHSHRDSGSDDGGLVDLSHAPAETDYNPI